jgi:hypothetical protein
MDGMEYFSVSANAMLCHWIYLKTSPWHELSRTCLSMSYSNVWYSSSLYALSRSVHHCLKPSGLLGCVFIYSSFPFFSKFLLSRWNRATKLWNGFRMRWMTCSSPFPLDKGSSHVCDPVPHVLYYFGKPRCTPVESLYVVTWRALDATISTMGLHQHVVGRQESNT